MKRALLSVCILSACSSVDVVAPVDAAADAVAEGCGANDPCHIYSTADGGCAVVGDSDGARCSDTTFCVAAMCAPLPCDTVADCYFYNCAKTVCAAGECSVTLDPVGTICAGGHCDGKGVCS